MTEPTHPPATTVRRRWFRRLLAVTAAHAIVSLFAIFLAFLLGWATFAGTLPDPQGWHTEAPGSEFTAADARPGYTLADYLAQEQRAFAELDALIDGPWKPEAARAFSRYNRASPSFPGTGFQRDWNRTTILEPDLGPDLGQGSAPVGGALLIHGLSDSPYSLRAAAEQFHARGWAVVALRVPGHGTCPAALVEASWRDWTAAVRIAAQGLRGKLPPDAPMVIVGFSNGGALAIDYTLDTLEDPALPAPAGIILFSPMIGITPFAKITRLHHLIAWIPAFEKVRWSRIEEEIDPYKYASWPTNASEQAFLLTQRLTRRLAALHRRGLTDRMPPVLTFQSVVDSTVSLVDLWQNLYDRLPAGQSELVLFDLNRLPLLEDLLKNNNEPFIDARLESPSLTYRLTLITKAESDARSGAMLARTRDADGYTETPLSIVWPEGVFSLSHGAIPIPADDPVLGTRDATEAFPAPNLGSIQLRGEHGVLRISESITMRLRHNPFYDFVEQRTEAWITELAKSARENRR